MNAFQEFFLENIVRDERKVEKMQNLSFGGCFLIGISCCKATNVGYLPLSLE
jgi:hypothetical protein